MKNSSNKGLVSNHAIIQFFLMQLFRENLIDTDAYVFTRNIGYCIRPTERWKHYATDMLDNALKVCDTLGIKEVILTCDKSNIASSNVIKNCKGELVEEFHSNTFKKDIQKYIIKR